jgi:hypothetical protein
MMETEETTALEQFFTVLAFGGAICVGAEQGFWPAVVTFYVIALIGGFIQAVMNSAAGPLLKKVGTAVVIGLIVHGVSGEYEVGSVLGLVIGALVG